MLRRGGHKHATGELHIAGTGPDGLKIKLCCINHTGGKKDYSIALVVGNRFDGLLVEIDHVDVDRLIADLEYSRAWLADPEADDEPAAYRATETLR